METLATWVRSHGTLLFGLGAFSFLSALAGLLLVPLMVVRIPADYFAPPHRNPTFWSRRHPVLRWSFRIVKTALGLILVLLGLALLVLPGQGLLTLLAGLTLMEFPGKYRLERWLVRRPPILRAANWMRRRAGREALQVDG